MRSRALLTIAAWLAAIGLCLYVIAHTRFTADMSAFLPQHPTAQQALLVEQLKEGVLSRTLLIGIAGADAAQRAELSRRLAQRLANEPTIAAIRNGDDTALQRDRELLFGHRYLLSPAVDVHRFSAEGLHDAIANSIDLLGSPAGMLLKKLLPRDPTGELVELLQGFDGDSAPATQFGVWSSRDGQRALLIAQSRGAGSDTDAQEAAIAAVRAAFAAANAQLESRNADAAHGAHLLISGAPVFAVEARATIRAEVRRLSIISAVGVSLLLLVAYRSFAALAFGLLPVVSGALAGIAAVSLGFGAVHGLTIGFGTTLIGEAVDYTIYYLVQSRSSGDQGRWMERFWPTIRLGVLTSICGFAALLLSGFPGLAQLGLYSIAGLVTAAATTRYVLPSLIARLAPRLHIRELGAGPLGRHAGGLLLHLAATRGQWLLALLAVASIGVLAYRHDTIWSHSLSSLSPISTEQEKRDTLLRGDLGAPDLRYLVVVGGDDREMALTRAERVQTVLDRLVADGVIAGYDSPVRFLPSRTTQERRRAALPARSELAQRLGLATRDLPLRADKLAPFLDDVEAARNAPLLDIDQLRDSSLGLMVESLLIERDAAHGERWNVLMPLRSVTGRDIDAARVQQALAQLPDADALCLDLAGESNRIYDAYLHEAIVFSLAGLAAIAVLLAFALRSIVRALRVLLPLTLAVLFVIAALVLTGEKLTLLHLVGMLLIVAVGSNYALFFDQGAYEGFDADTLTSLLLASIATLIGFGVLALAKVPVLHAIGITVGPGALLALLLSAMLAARRTP